MRTRHRAEREGRQSSGHTLGSCVYPGIKRVSLNRPDNFLRNCGTGDFSPREW